MNEPAILTEGLSVRYGRMEAVHSLNMEVPRRSIYAFLGPNGAGKSTTLSVLVNILRPSAGRACVLGRESTSLSPEDFTRIGYVAESQELPNWMTGAQMIDFLKPFYPNWDEAFERKLGLTLELPKERKIRQMSRGEKMKLRLLMSMAYRPELLILDEPFSGLDPLVREELSAGLLELVGDGDWTVILASHDVEELERLADHAGFLANGHLHFSEPVEALQRRFHRVTACFETDPLTENIPPNWSGLEHANRELRFVDEAFSRDDCRANLEKMGTLISMDARTMSLREIFIATTRRSRVGEAVFS
ncbi:MAG: ABC transporter ATP-binding protein [Opitutales bacterium]|nr:ABC transporter ATP-binding protein [Opitutales bacterium]